MVLLAATLAMGFFQVLGIASVLPFMSLVMQPELVSSNRWLYWLYDSMNFASVDSFVIFTGVIMLVIIVLGSLVSIMATLLKNRFVWQQNHNLATSLLRKYLSLPYVYFLSNHSATLSKNILSEVNEFTSRFLIPLVNMISRSIVVLFILIMLLVVEPFVTFFAVLLLGSAYAVIYISISQRLRLGGNKWIEANTGRYKAASEAFGGIKDIKLMARERYFSDRFQVHSKKFSDLNAWNEVVGQVPRHILEIVAFGGVVTLILILITIRGTAQNVIPLVGFFAFAGYRLIPAIQEIYASMTMVQFNKAIMEKIYEDMKEGVSDKAVKSTRELQEPLPFKNHVQLNKIAYSYPQTNKPVLKNISLEINRHTSIAIIGPTGAGKTTLVDIILGLLTPQQGEIIVDGTIITNANLQGWQRNLGYVPQQIYLCDDTIARNIAFGLPDEEIDDQALEEAARIANIHSFIVDELPAGYGTVIGERGIRLSGGQRQRIGIARALYCNPEILVLDEATNSLDGITEEAVLKALENAAKLKTLIIIAHRLTTTINCDVIYMLDKGEIVDQGSYQELMNSSAQFRAMARQQG